MVLKIKYRLAPVVVENDVNRTLRDLAKEFQEIFEDDNKANIFEKELRAKFDLNGTENTPRGKTNSIFGEKTKMNKKQKKQLVPIWKEYEDKRAQILKEYEDKEAPIWKEYEDKRAPIWKEYEDKRAQILKEYEDKRAQILKEKKQK